MNDFIKKYVHVTTPEVYGSMDCWQKESFDFDPSTPYAVSRAAADMSLHSYWDAFQFPVVFTRAANVYGPGQQLYRIIPRTIMSIKLGRKLQLHGGGISTRSFIHMDDVSTATLRIARDSPAGEIYHISTNDIISIRDLVELICEMMNVDFESVVEVGEERLGKDAAYLLDSSKLRDTFNWQDRIPLKKGINEVIKWVDGNFDNLKTQPQDYIHKP